ncbi:PREDICTED: protein FAM71B-like [Elephantulus edwardii]|uniref:protein FAM71B-like n=1 Tax=Elephantulus edwardii TaxID=28737 RepID=UPI0003F05A44|nr:PREDICTED: protein FAM71B-like [Elephantulus edwardii]
MNNEGVLPYCVTNGYRSMGVFNTSMGDLQKQLHRGGEYDIFKYAPMFASDFIQISRKGEVIDVYNHVRMVTVSITSTSPVLPLPDVMLLARPVRVCEDHNGYSQPTKRKSRKATKTLELTRLLPLKFVKISIHDREKQQLCLKLATGRSFYLQLLPSSDACEDLFCYWEKLVFVLRQTMKNYSSTPSVQTGDLANTSKCLTDDNRSIMTADLDAEGVRDESRLHKFQEVSGATSSAYAGGEGIGIQQPSHGMSASRAGPTTSYTMGAAVAGTTAGSTVEDALAGTRAGSPSGTTVAGTTAGRSKSAVNIAITKASGPAQTNAALAGVITKSPRVSRGPSKAIAGTAIVPSESANMVLASAISLSVEDTVATSYSPGSSMNTIFTGVPTNKPVSKDAELPHHSTLKSEGYMSEQDGRQRVSKLNIEVQKEKKERRSKRDKNPTRISSHHHRKGGDKPTQKSSSHWSLANHGAGREDKKERGHSNTKGKGQRSSSHKCIIRSPTPKASRTTRILGQTQSSTTRSDLVLKIVSRISSFIKNFGVVPASRAVITSHERESDIVAATMERYNIEYKMEKAPGHVQDVEITDSMTSETTETIIFASKAT